MIVGGFVINRPKYIEKLLALKDRELIKIVTGVRRSGKSTIFKLYQGELLKSGINKKQIQNINLEDIDNESLLDYKKLYEHVKNNLIPNKKNYIFLDEVQNVVDFQKAVRSLFDIENVDLYLTGSNSKLQSGKWATSIAGRYVEIHVLPLSFKEFESGYPHKNESLDKKFEKYVESSAFPYVINFIKDDHNVDFEEEEKEKILINDYLLGIYHSIILKDVAENNDIKEIGRLEILLRFIADVIGSEVSIKNISAQLTLNGTQISPATVENYLEAFLKSYILYRINRYDIKGKKILKTLNKYYLVDVGMRKIFLGSKKSDRGHLLENVVFLELLRRGYKVYIGKVDAYDKKEKKIKTTEVDFIAEGVGGVEYYQVAESVKSNDVLERELRPLDSINDHNPKFLLTRDYGSFSHNGIKQLNVLEWLMQRN